MATAKNVQVNVTNKLGSAYTMTVLYTDTNGAVGETPPQYVGGNVKNHKYTFELQDPHPDESFSVLLYYGSSMAEYPVINKSYDASTTCAKVALGVVSRLQLALASIFFTLVLIILIVALVTAIRHSSRARTAGGGTPDTMMFGGNLGKM